MELKGGLALNTRATPPDPAEHGGCDAPCCSSSLYTTIHKHGGSIHHGIKWKVLTGQWDCVLQYIVHGLLYWQHRASRPPCATASGGVTF